VRSDSSPGGDRPAADQGCSRELWWGERNWPVAHQGRVGRSPPPIHWVSSRLRARRVAARQPSALRIVCGCGRATSKRWWFLPPDFRARRRALPDPARSGGGSSLLVRRGNTGLGGPQQAPLIKGARRARPSASTSSLRTIGSGNHRPAALAPCRQGQGVPRTGRQAA